MPDLIVTLFDPAQTGPVFGFVDDAQQQAEQVAPVVALAGAALLVTLTLGDHESA